jgi:hypothetical protein
MHIPGNIKNIQTVTGSYSIYETQAVKRELNMIWNLLYINLYRLLGHCYFTIHDWYVVCNSAFVTQQKKAFACIYKGPLLRATWENYILHWGLYFGEQELLT